MKIKLSRQQWQKIGQAAGWKDEFAVNTPGEKGWETVEIVTHHKAAKQAVEYALQKVTLVENEKDEVDYQDLEYLRNNLVSALQSLEALKNAIQKKI